MFNINRDTARAFSFFPKLDIKSLIIAKITMVITGIKYINSLIKVDNVNSLNITAPL
jgi:hypothetical protein